MNSRLEFSLYRSERERERRMSEKDKRRMSLVKCPMPGGYMTVVQYCSDLAILRYNLGTLHWHIPTGTSLSSWQAEFAYKDS